MCLYIVFVVVFTGVGTPSRPHLQAAYLHSALLALVTSGVPPHPPAKYQSSHQLAYRWSEIFVGW